MYSVIVIAVLAFLSAFISSACKIIDHQRKGLKRITIWGWIIIGLNISIILLSAFQFRQNEIDLKNNEQRANIKQINRDSVSKAQNDSSLFVMKTKYENIIIDLNHRLNTRFDKIEKKIDDKEDYNKYLTETNNSSMEYLVKRYPYGYVLFGIWDGNFVYKPSLKSTDLKIIADWGKTKLEWNRLSNTLKLKIENLSMKNEKINIHADTSVTNNILIRPKGTESLVGGIYLGQNVNMYLEQLDNKYPDNPIFAIGFKK